MSRSILETSNADAVCAATHETFGHLAPTIGTHTIEMLFVWTIYGDMVIIDNLHPTLENSPWQFACFNELVWELISPNAVEHEKRLKKGVVYKFTGDVTWGEVEGEYPSWGDAITMTDWEGDVEEVYALEEAE